VATRFVVTCSGGAASCALHTSDGVAELDTPRSFTNPLPAGALAELAWYYEAYPINAGPSGHFRAAHIEAQLPLWGVALFEAILPKPSAVREAWEALEDHDVSLWLTGRSAEFLSLPWELARRSTNAQPLGQFHGITRALDPSSGVALTSLGHVSRVLLVISRPTGSPAISFMLFAQELLAQLRAASIEVEVLRPPTFEMFCARVRAAADEGRPFDIVHFDGHGTLGDAGDGRGRVARLTFETASGAPRHVDGATLADHLIGRPIPLVVLAACHSGGVAPSAAAESSVAASLLDRGRAAAVVAMGYAVCGDAASLFLGAFYGAALRGQPLAQAVSEGRNLLARSPVRHREHGSIDLQDWPIPVLYADAAAAFEPATAAADASPAQRLAGRDADYFSLERQLRTSRCVALDGLVGVGKTAFAREFMDWWSVTIAGGTLPCIVDAAGAASLRQLEAAISKAGGPADIARMLASAGGPLLIDGLDDLEHWSEHERSVFFALVSGGPDLRRPVLLAGRGITRAGDSVPTRTLGSLASDALRAVWPADVDATPAALSFVDGHPGCAVAATAAQPGDLFPVALAEDALAPVRSALTSLDVPTRRRLRLIARHGPRLEFQCLKHLTRYFSHPLEAGDHDEADGPPAGTWDLPGVPYTPYEDWQDLVSRCCAVGLAEPVIGDIYRLHPALGPALAESWRVESGANFDAEWAALGDRIDDAVLATASQLSMFMAMGTGMSDLTLNGPMRIVDPGYIREQMKVLEPHIKAAILRSIDRGGTLGAGFAAQALTMLWNENSRPDIAHCDEVLARLRPHTDEADRRASRMLRFVAVQQLALSRTPFRSDPEAELQEMLAEPEEWGDVGLGLSVGRPELLLTLAIARDTRGRPADAEPVAREAVEAFLARDGPAGTARAKHSLTTILRNLGRASAAFAVADQGGDDLQPYTPAEVMELVNEQANAAFDVGDFARAMDLQLSNLAAADENPRQRARIMHELGLLCFASGRPRDAEQWFLKSLAIKEALSGPAEAVRTLLMLGQLAVERQGDAEAESWFARVRATAGPQEAPGRDALIGLAGIASRRGDADTALDQVLEALAAARGLPEEGRTVAQAHEVLSVETAARVEARWRSSHGTGLLGADRLRLAECFARIGLAELTASIAEPLISADDPGLAGRALVLKAEAFLTRGADAEAWDPINDTADSLEAAEQALHRLEGAGPSWSRGAALLVKATILCARGQTSEGADRAAEAVGELEAFREGPDIEALIDFARANQLLGQVSRGLGRWDAAAAAHLAEAEAHRLCMAGNAGFRPRRFEALRHAIASLLHAGQPERALSIVTVLRSELAQAHLGPGACAAEPPMGLVVQMTIEALRALGDEDAVREVIAERWSELDPFAESNAPGVLHEYASWSLSLLQMSKEPDPSLATRLHDVLAIANDVNGFRPEHAAAASLLVWQCLQDGHRGVAESLRASLENLDRRATDRADIAAATARAEFDFTMEHSVAMDVEEIESLARRLRAGVVAMKDPLTALRFGFAVEHALAKRMIAGQSRRALELAADLEEVALGRPDLQAACRTAFFGCRRNLTIGLASGGDLRGAIRQVHRILEIAVIAGGAVVFNGEEHAAGDSEEVRSPGFQILDAVSHLMGRAAAANEVPAAADLLLRCIDTSILHPRNDLVIAAVFAGTSNLLMRVPVPLEKLRRIHAGLGEVRRERPDSALLARAFAVGAMAEIFVERTKGDIAEARAAFAELAVAGEGDDAIALLVAETGLGLAKDLGQRGDTLGLAEVMTTTMKAVCRSTALEPVIDDLAGGTDFAIRVFLDHGNCVTPPTLLDAACTLRATYSGSAELASTVGVGIANLIGVTCDTAQFAAWLQELRSLGPASLVPQLAEIRSAAMANAILGAGENGLPGAADEIYRELEQLLRIDPRGPRPSALAPAFGSRITVLRKEGSLDQVLRELFEIASSELAPDWLAVATSHTAAIAGELWSVAEPNGRKRLSALIEQLWRDDLSRAALQAALDPRLLDEIRTLR